MKGFLLNIEEKSGPFTGFTRWERATWYPFPFLAEDHLIQAASVYQSSFERLWQHTHKIHRSPLCPSACFQWKFQLLLCRIWPLWHATLGEVPIHSSLKASETSISITFNANNDVNNAIPDNIRKTCYETGNRIEISNHKYPDFNWTC